MKSVLGLRAIFVFLVMKEEEINEDALTPQLTEHLVKHIGTMWKRLARELNFSEDEISYFESDNDDDQERTLKMITVWQVGMKSS